MLELSVDQKGTATITLNRPEVHNAFDDTLIAELKETLQTTGADQAIRIVVLAANGKSFSAGADLNWMRRMGDVSEADNVADAMRLAELLETLEHMPKPTVAIVHGATYG
ncbi:MAG: enoyl-CoA hydratase-related protein, partial [Arenicellales bacterium]